MSLFEVEKQARLLARENRLSEPGIRKVIWFPDNGEVRLIETMDAIPKSQSKVAAFYFRADAKQELPFPSRIGLIRPEEEGRLPLPDQWGDWSDGKEL